MEDTRAIRTIHKAEEPEMYEEYARLIVKGCSRHCHDNLSNRSCARELGHEGLHMEERTLVIFAWVRALKPTSR